MITPPAAPLPVTVMLLTWISIVKIILYIRGNIISSSVVDPIGVRLLIITNEHSKQDDHSNLPDKADCWKTDSNIGVFGHFKSMLILPKRRSGDDSGIPFNRNV